LAVGDYNVILCDYKEYNAPYLTAVSNSKKIGANIAEFLTFMETQGCLTKNLHIIGHSLGGHIAGFVGQNLKNKAARTTGIRF